MAADGGQVADWFSKPGDTIMALMRRRDVTAECLAAHFDGGMQEVRELLEGSRRIDETVSDVLSRLLGGSQQFWFKRQENFEHALERAVATATAEAEDWLAHVPIPGKSGRKRKSAASIQAEVQRRMMFFNVSTLASWERRYGLICNETHFRRSMSFVPQDTSVLLWLRRGELEADMIQTRSWSPDGLRDRVLEIRKLTKIKDPSRFLPKLRSLCAEAGVAVVVVRAPKGCHASGATRLIAADKAMMLLSFRHLADDQFWFTVFHEIGHLVLHSGETFVDGDETPNDDFEQEANEFARKCIIPANREPEFSELAANRNAIIRFSVSLGIAPGLTVGQMQRRGIIEHRQMNFLKRRWAWEDIEHAVV